MDKLGLRTVDPIGGLSDHIYHTDAVYNLRMGFVFMVNNFRCPFAGTDSEDSLGATSITFSPLFPEGHPRRLDNRYMRPGGGAKSYVDCIQIRIGAIPPYARKIALVLLRD